MYQIFAGDDLIAELDLHTLGSLSFAAQNMEVDEAELEEACLNQSEIQGYTIRIKSQGDVPLTYIPTMLAA
jgi:hypothetical protein